MYFKDGKPVKRANTVKQRLHLLNKHTNDKYEIIEHIYFGYAILKNGDKIFDTQNKLVYQTKLGKLCYDNKLTDVYSNIIV